MAKDKNSADFELLATLSVSTGFQYFKAMNEALAADTQRCLKECLDLKKQDDPTTPIDPYHYKEMSFWYRNLARASMAYVEGLLYVMRQLIVASEERDEIELTEGERWLVKERTFSFNPEAKDRKKRIKERGRFNRLSENFVLALDLFPRVFGSTYEVDFSGEGWRSMKSLIELRNSVTHPKTVEDVLLRADAPGMIQSATLWFLDVMKGIFQSVDLQMIEEDMRKTANSPEMRELLRQKKERRGA
jgi:hypothetical protein